MQAWNLSERVNEPYIFECELDKPSKHHNFLFFSFFLCPFFHFLCQLSTFKSQTKCPSIESNALMMPRWNLRGGRLGLGEHGMQQHDREREDWEKVVIFYLWKNKNAVLLITAMLHCYEPTRTIIFTTLWL